MSMKRTHLFLFAFLLLFVSACSPEISIPPTVEIIETPTQIFIITATLPATVTAFPTQTPIPPTATSLFSVVEGQTTSLVNVRQEPSAASVQIGEVAIFDKVQIIGKDPSNKWWMIEFPTSANGKGWVTMEFVLVTPDTSRVPVINANVGAGQPAPTTEAGQTGGESAPTVAPTAVFASAPEDGDSSERPALDKILSETTGTYLEYRSELSAPEGDGDDWIKFAFDGSFGAEKHVNLILNCSGSGKVNLELLQNGVALQTWPNLTCGRASQLLLYLYTGAPYHVHIYTTSENGAPSYMNYSISAELVK